MKPELLYEAHQNPESKETIWRQLAQQYAENVQHLNWLHILELLPEEGSVGIRDAEGKPYPLPTFEQIQHLFEKNWQLLTKKWEQGFTQLQLTPIAKPLPTFFHIFQHALRRVPQLYAPHTTDEVQLQKVQLSEWEVIWFYSEILSEQLSQTLYFPQKVGRMQYHGLTKTEVIAQSLTTSAPGWHVCLVQPNYLKATNQEATVAHLAERTDDRQNFKNDYLPKIYLNQIRRLSMYEGESGFTLEDYFTHFLLNVLRTSQVINNMNDQNGLLCLGSYSPAEGATYCVGWDLWDGHLVLDTFDFDERDESYGCQTVVRLT